MDREVLLAYVPAFKRPRSARCPRRARKQSSGAAQNWTVISLAACVVGLGCIWYRLHTLTKFNRYNLFVLKNYYRLKSLESRV